MRKKEKDPTKDTWLVSPFVNAASQIRTKRRNAFGQPHAPCHNCNAVVNVRMLENICNWLMAQLEWKKTDLSNAMFKVPSPVKYSLCDMRTKNNKQKHTLLVAT